MTVVIRNVITLNYPYRVSHIEMRYYRQRKKTEIKYFSYKNMRLYSRKLNDFLIFGTF